MSAVQSEQPALPKDRAMAAPVLRTLVICDLAESTALVEQLGDQRAAELMRHHDRLARDLLHRHGGQEIDKTDGFLLLFERPVRAVAFALDYQHRLQAFSRKESVPLQSRIGIHVGDVMLWDNDADDIAQGAKPVELEGLVKPVASRLMSIARPGQILLSGIAYSLAHRAQAELTGVTKLRWRAHGNYRFKGVLDPVLVYEVGEENVAPFTAPAWTGKAHREIPWWRRPGTMVIEAAVVFAVIAVPAYFSLRSPPAIAFASRDWVVVGDLKNLTTDTNFNDSLQSAFRIGLEQSRFVNVLSDLKARETLKLMQRDPDKTAIDRETGSEIAIRDGVRALILPSVAEIGGRVRVTAEVIDPHTQTTVYSESADGVGENSVLPALDKVNRQLRLRLGEALATVTNESQPLEQVATRSLEALRLYSLGDKAYDAGDVKGALAFYQQALKLDPAFARAYLALSRTFVRTGQSADAIKALESAQLHADRMSPREALSAEAWKASLVGSQNAAIEQWKSVAQLYPDYFNAHGHYAYFSREFANRYGPEIIKSGEKCASPLSPSLSVCQELLGLLYLGNERYADALKQFSATGLTSVASVADSARSLAAQRQYVQAETKLRPVSSGIASLDISMRETPIAMAFDQGHWDEAWKQFDAAKHDAAKVDAGLFNYFLGIEASLIFLREPDVAVKTTARDYVKVAVDELNNATAALDRADAQFAVLFAAYLAAHAGDIPLAQGTLDRVGPEPQSGEYPALAKMLVIVRAEITRAAGKPKEAIALFGANLDDSA